MLEICLWVFTSGTGIVDIPEKATECLQLSLLSTSHFFASAFHGLCFVHVGISPTILRTSKWAAFISWSPSLIRWIKYGQFAVVVFLYISLSLSRQGIPRDWPCWSSFRACCPVRFESILQAMDWFDRKQAKLGTDVSLLTQVFVCCASRWPRQPLNLPRLGTAWPC